MTLPGGTYVLRITNQDTGTLARFNTVIIWYELGTDEFQISGGAAA